MKKILIIFMLFNLIFLSYMAYKKNYQYKYDLIEIDPIEPEVEPPEPEEPKEVVPSFDKISPFSQRISEKTIYADIMNHSNNPVFGYDRSTNAHETCHMIHAYYRNRLGFKGNALYVLDSRLVKLKEPNIRKKDVINYLPKELRSYRYGTYISGQTEWDDTPTYILDEWTAYINGGKVDVEDIQLGKKKEWTDGISGCLDFSIYSIALAMAVKAKDSSFFEENKQFKDFIHWQLKIARQTFDVGSKMKELMWAEQDKLLNNLRLESSAKDMRDFINEYFSGIWLESNEVIQTQYSDWHDGKQIKLKMIPPFARNLSDGI